jgi:hypothetical protein
VIVERRLSAPINVGPDLALAASAFAGGYVGHGSLSKLFDSV